MEYVCDLCNKKLKSQKALDYHKSHQACRELPYPCKYCNKGFATESNMYRHIRSSCEAKKEDDREKEGIYERLLKLEEDNKKIQQENQKFQKEIAEGKTENKRLQKEVATMKKIVKKTTNNPVSNVTNNINKGNINKGNVHIGDVNNVANIILVGYGHEDISKIDRNDVIKALQNGFKSTVKLTETLHFNPKYPEYHNVYISNMKDKYAMTYDGKDWNLMMKDELINKIYDDKKNYIEENLDEFVESLSVSRKKALDRWLEADDENEKISEIKEEIKLLLYNKRGMAEQKLKKPTTRTICKASKKTIKDKED